MSNAAIITVDLIAIAVWLRVIWPLMRDCIEQELAGFATMLAVVSVILLGKPISDIRQFIWMLGL